MLLIKYQIMELGVGSCLMITRSLTKQVIGSHRLGEKSSVCLRETVWFLIIMDLRMPEKQAGMG